MPDETTAAAVATDPMAGVADALREFATTIRDEIRALRPVTPPAADPTPPARNPVLVPGGVSPADTMRDQWTANGYTRADFEVAMMIRDGARSMARPVD